MAIFATRTGSNKASSGLSLKLNDSIRDGSILVFDADARAFVDRQPSGSIPVAGARNLGGNNSLGVYAGNDAGILEFRDIQAGSGVSIGYDGNSLIISADVSADKMSVPGSYRVTIDNDNTGDGAFEIWTSISTLSTPLILQPSVLARIVGNDIFAGNENGHGYFSSTTVNFTSSGFEPGMWIYAANAGDQTGWWMIDDVVLSNIDGETIHKLVLQETFTGAAAFNLGGPKPSVTFSHSDVFVSDSHTLLSRTIDFGSHGLFSGTVIEITGSGVNDGVYTVMGTMAPGMTEYGYTYSVLEVAEPFQLLGPISTPISITIRATDVPTGFAVDKCGNVDARSIAATTMRVGDVTTGSYTPQRPDDVVRKDNLDVVASRVNRAKLFFFSSLG